MECIDPNNFYQNYLTPSEWKNEPHLPRLVNLIKDLMGATHKATILDIGCNDGKFLERLKKEGFKKIFGIEPSENSYQAALSKGLKVTKAFFNKKIAGEVYSKGFFDLVVTRQVLEHISNLDNFMEGVNLIIKDNGCLVIEIPDSEWNLDYLDYALWEEHINYFTLNTVSTLLRKHSFEIFHYEVTLFAGKALTVFCRRSNSTNLIQNRKEEETKILKYKQSWKGYNKKLRVFLDSINYPIAVYGCGARSSNFVNLTGIGNRIESFVDDQKEKQGLYVPGSNLIISDWIEDLHRDFVFLLGVNTENEYKVINNRSMTKDKYYSILPPSRNLPKFWNKLIYG